MKYPDITIAYKGTSTIKEAYDIHLRCLKDTMTAAATMMNYDLLLETKRELVGYVAHLDHQMFKCKHPELAKKSPDIFEKGLQKINQEVPGWTINNSGERIELEIE